MKDTFTLSTQEVMLPEVLFKRIKKKFETKDQENHESRRINQVCQKTIETQDQENEEKYLFPGKSSQESKFSQDVTSCPSF